MEQMGNLNQNIILGDDQQELVIRYGQAAEVEPPVKFEFDGVLSAPADYYEGRKDKLDWSHAVIRLDRGGARLALIRDNRDRHSDEVTGQLSFSDEAMALFDSTTNWTSGSMSMDGMAEHLRYKGHLFSDRVAHKELVKAFINYDMRVTNTVSNKVDDRKGAKRTEESIIKENGIPQSFKIEIPVFRGGEVLEFECQVLAAARGGAVKVWYECEDLRYEAIKLRDRMLDAVMARMDPITILEE